MAVLEKGVKRHGKDLNYKCTYQCSVCGYEGYRYILPHSVYVPCLDCKSKLAVKSISGDKKVNGLPIPDKQGNYFTAHEVSIKKRK